MNDIMSYAVCKECSWKLEGTYKELYEKSAEHVFQRNHKVTIFNPKIGGLTLVKRGSKE